MSNGKTHPMLTESKVAIAELLDGIEYEANLVVTCGDGSEERDFMLDLKIARLEAQVREYGIKAKQLVRMQAGERRPA